MLISRGDGRDVTLVDSVTLAFNLITRNKMSDQDLSCTVHLRSLMTTRPMIFV